MLIKNSFNSSIILRFSLKRIHSYGQRRCEIKEAKRAEERVFDLLMAETEPIFTLGQISMIFLSAKTLNKIDHSETHLSTSMESNSASLLIFKKGV